MRNSTQENSFLASYFRSGLTKNEIKDKDIGGNLQINRLREKSKKLLKLDIENDSQLRPVSIQNRKFRCGINNSWVFVNKNGLENTINLTRIDKDLLGFKGVIHVDNYFCDSMLGFIFELSFVSKI